MVFYLWNNDKRWSATQNKIGWLGAKNSEWKIVRWLKCREWTSTLIEGSRYWFCSTFCFFFENFNKKTFVKRQKTVCPDSRPKWPLSPHPSTSHAVYVGVCVTVYHTHAQTHTYTSFVAKIWQTMGTPAINVEALQSCQRPAPQTIFFWRALARRKATFCEFSAVFLSFYTFQKWRFWRTHFWHMNIYCCNMMKGWVDLKKFQQNSDFIH